MCINILLKDILHWLRRKIVLDLVHFRLQVSGYSYGELSWSYLNQAYLEMIGLYLYTHVILFILLLRVLLWNIQVNGQ